MTARCWRCGQANPLTPADPKAQALRRSETARLARLHGAAREAGRGAAGVAAWQALYDYVGTLTAKGRSGGQMAVALGVSKQSVSKMQAKARVG